MKKIHSK